MEYLKKKDKYNRSQQQHVDTSAVKEINPNCLTIDDIILAEKGLPLQQYDAFILFADKDIDFATEMIEKVESFGMKVKTIAPSNTDNLIDNLFITVVR